MYLSSSIFFLSAKGAAPIDFYSCIDYQNTTAAIATYNCVCKCVFPDFVTILLRQHY